MRSPSLLFCALMALCVISMAPNSFAAVTEVVISAETIRDFGTKSPQYTEFVQDTDASNGLAFKFTGGGTNPLRPDPEAWWELEFWCDAGTYFIWARGKSNFSTGTDSFWLQFDDQLDTDDHTANPDWRGHGVGNWLDFVRPGIYKWNKTVVTWRAKYTGLHIVRVQPREASHFIDQLLISQDQEDRPRDRPWPTEFPRKDPRGPDGEETVTTVVNTPRNDEQPAADSGVGYAFSKTPIRLDDTFTLDIRAEDIVDLAGWQFDIAFDPGILEAIDVTDGDFLKKNGADTFFRDGRIDNANGKITVLSSARLSIGDVSGTGTLLQVRFKAKLVGEIGLTLQEFQFGSSTGDIIPAGPLQIRIVVEERRVPGDVNRDGQVSILDLILVAQQLGQRVPAGSAVDINGDGVVSILDLIHVAQAMAESLAAPPAKTESVDAATIEAWIAQARMEEDGSLAFKQGVENLENLLASLIPEEPALLANYPNPFNPETWIPYQLAESTEVTLTIHDMPGQLVRRLALGHQAAGIYKSQSRAVYWNGRNQLGESVASGL